MTKQISLKERIEKLNNSSYKINDVILTNLKTHREIEMFSMIKELEEIIEMQSEAILKALNACAHGNSDLLIDSLCDSRIKAQQLLNGGENEND